jgi:hypothetical protein
LQQFVLPIQQVLRHRIVSRQTDRALAAPVAEGQAAGTLEPFARGIVDPQIHRIAHQQGEHRAAMEQPDAAEHTARHRSSGASRSRMNASKPRLTAILRTPAGRLHHQRQCSHHRQHVLRHSSSTDTRQIASPP